MIYIACALYMEAAPFIRRCSCQKNPDFTHEQVFCGEDVTVIITGTSPVPAAIALTEVLVRLSPASDDIFLNVGTCGCSDSEVQAGSLFLVHSILENATGRVFYPDLLYMSEHRTGALTTFSVPSDAPCGTLLFDMEAAGLYQAAISFFSTDRLFFFKIVSDFGEDSSLVSPTDIHDLLAEHVDGILDSAVRFASYTSRRFFYSPEEEAVIDYFCRSLQCSVTMEHELRRLIMYYELERGYAIAHLRDFFTRHGLSYEDNVILESRKEGKHVLEAYRLECLC